MELDFKKKLIIGCFIAVVLLISGYLYYEYVNSSNNTDTIIENSVDEDGNGVGVKKAILNEIETKEENIIIVHIAGAVCNPRNCKDKRGFKTL